MNEDEAVKIEDSKEPKVESEIRRQTNIFPFLLRRTALYLQLTTFGNLEFHCFQVFFYGFAIRNM